MLLGIFLNQWGPGLYGNPQKEVAAPGAKTQEKNPFNTRLKELISGKRWKELSGWFAPGDNGPEVLEKYFANVRSINIMDDQPNKLVYKVKFAKRGEIGVITYLIKNGKYAGVQIKNQIRPLYFIESFKKYRAVNVKISVGDAEIHFINGYFYQTSPFDFLLLFQGRWKFYIKPKDREERLTLDRQFGSDSFSRTAGAGIFILPGEKFLETLPFEGEVKELENEVKSLYHLYRDGYGIKIQQFNEYWYLPFSNETNLVVFKKDKNAFYYYSYHQNSAPDTLLGGSDDNRMILSYNAHRGLKLSFGTGETVSGVKMSLFFNPQTHFLSGTTTIDYKAPSTLRVLALAKKLKLVGNLKLDAKGLNVFRKKDRYYLMGPEEKSLSLFFKGHIDPTIENFEFFQSYSDMHTLKEIDQPKVFYLSRTQNFYPNPGDDFFKTTLNITLPGKLNCLASGNLVEKKIRDASIFKFESIASKGISLVVGEFSMTRKLHSRIPIQFFTYPAFAYPRGLDFEEIQHGFNFFLDTFGSLDLSAVNIMMKKGYAEGGISNYGFIVMNVLPPWGEIARSDSLTGVARVNVTPFDKKRIQSPILIRTKLEDNILHELAHQWWGGMISWKSYRDVWLTEGLAQFSVLYYLKKHVAERRFNRIIKRVKRWIMRHADVGPVAYGARIRSLENKTEPYQSIVYNKPAFVFLMLMDVIGEKEVLRRLKAVLEEYKYKSISTMQFVRKFCGKDEILLHFFRKWFYSRTIPTVELRLVTDHEEYDAETFKKVAIRIFQVGEEEDRDFIFPLYLKVTTEKGTSIEKVIVKRPVQTFIISRESAIRTIDIVSSIPLVKERKVLQRQQ